MVRSQLLPAQDQYLSRHLRTRRPSREAGSCNEAQGSHVVSGAENRLSAFWKRGREADQPVQRF